MYIHLSPETIQLLSDLAVISAKGANAKGANRLANEHEIAAAHEAATAVLASYQAQLAHIEERGTQLIQLAHAENAIIKAEYAQANTLPVEILVANEGGDLALQLVAINIDAPYECDLLIERNMNSNDVLMHTFNSTRQEPAITVNIELDRSRKLWIHGTEVQDRRSYGTKIN